MKPLILSFLFLMACLSVVAQKQPADSAQVAPVTITKDTVTVDHTDADIGTQEGVYYFLSQKEFWLSVIIILLLLIVLGIEAWLIKSRKFTDEAAIRLIIVTIVILGTLFLFVSGYSDKQIAPAFGLFGTICGYLFGKSAATKDKDQPQQ